MRSQGCCLGLGYGLSLKLSRRGRPKADRSRDRSKLVGIIHGVVAQARLCGSRVL